jgi:hypothetical protein
MEFVNDEFAVSSKFNCSTIFVVGYTIQSTVATPLSVQLAPMCALVV